MIEIGSSDAAAVMGVSPRETPWMLYARKIGLLPDDKTDEEWMKRGRQLEHVVLRMFLEEMGLVDPRIVVLSSPDTQKFSTVYPWMRATPDAVIVGIDGVALVEVKNVRTPPPETPNVEWLVQCLHQRLVYPEAKLQYLVAFGGLQMRHWLIPKHQGAMDRLLREEESFLEMCEKQIPPPVRAADASVLAKAWPITVPVPVQLNDAVVPLLVNIAHADGIIKAAKDVKDESEAQLKQWMGEHEVGIAPDGSRVTWKHHERKAYSVDASRVRRLTIKAAKEEGHGDDE